MPFSDREKHREWERDYSKRKRQENPEYYLWKGAKKRAKDKQLDFDIEVSDIIIPQFCPLLNIPIIHITGTGKRRPDSPSLDRLDNSLGYVKGNILVVSWRANKLKADAEFQELQRLVNNWGAILRSR
jgi:hypothetical protein